MDYHGHTRPLCLATREQIGFPAVSEFLMTQEPGDGSPSFPKCVILQKNYMDVEVPGDNCFLYCEDCNKEYEGDCSVHGPLLMVADIQETRGSVDRAWKTLPVGLEIEESEIPGAGLGVWAYQDFDPRTCFGPYEGDVVNDEDTAHGSGYSWQIYADGQPSHFVDGQNCHTANWMRYVNCARTEEEQNLTAFQYNGHIYYKVYKKICVGSELLVWYGHKFARNLGIKRQLKLPQSQDTYPCDRCDLGFSSVMFLWKHLKKMHGGKLTAQLRFIVNTQGVTSCDIGKEIESQIQNSNHGYNENENVGSTGCEGALKDPMKHKEGSAGVRRYQCGQCGKEFKQSSHLKMHMKYHSGVRPFPCGECGKAFTQSSDLQRHIILHSGARPYPCTECERTFTRSCYLQKHLRCHIGVKPYKCSECGKAFSETSDLKSHMKSHSSIKPYLCGECGKAFTTSSDLTSHMRCHSDVKPHQCTECEKTFTRPSNLQAHMMCHSGDKPFECTECGKAFPLSSYLQKHMMCHSGVRPYQCTVCGKSFKQSGNLQTHKRSHTGVKPFPCNECGKAFSKSSDLQRHIRCHSGVKPYQCSECEKAFTTSGDLQRHMRCHSGEKPYQCTVCEKTFADSGGLQKHLRCHTGIRPHQCTVCEKAFTTSSHLHVHMRSHSGVRPYKCNQCGKAFTQSGNLQTHMRSHS